MNKKTDDWHLLLECWMELYVREPVVSAIPGFRTANGPALVEESLKGTWQLENAHFLSAWDKQLKRVSSTSFKARVRFQNVPSTLPNPSNYILSFYAPDM